MPFTLGSLITVKNPILLTQHRYFIVRLLPAQAEHGCRKMDPCSFPQFPPCPFFSPSDPHSSIILMHLLSFSRYSADKPRTVGNSYEHGWPTRGSTITLVTCELRMYLTNIADAPQKGSSFSVDTYPWKGHFPTPQQLILAQQLNRPWILLSWLLKDDMESGVFL
jgi:hypothetical protein